MVRCGALYLRLAEATHVRSQTPRTCLHRKDLHECHCTVLHQALNPNLPEITHWYKLQRHTGQTTVPKSPESRQYLLMALSHRERRIALYGILHSSFKLLRQSDHFRYHISGTLSPVYRCRTCVLSSCQPSSLTLFWSFHHMFSESGSRARHGVQGISHTERR